MTDYKDLGMPPVHRQKPITFGGVQLPEIPEPCNRVPHGPHGYCAGWEIELSPADLIGEHRGTGYEPERQVPLHERYRTFRDLPQRHEPHARCGPAGEGSPEARLLNVSRWSLAARIKHGVPLAELASHFQTLVEVEAALTPLCPYCKVRVAVVKQSHWSNCGEDECVDQASSDILASEGRSGYLRGAE